MSWTLLGAHLVVSVANVTAIVALIRATVNETFRIVDISITSSASWAPNVGRISGVEEDETATAGEIVWSSPDGSVSAD
jgi:hypothetical protein